MCIFRFSKKHHLVCFLSLLNYGDIGSVLIKHLQIVIPLSYPCYYTNLCPHKPHKPAHTHTHTLTLTHTHTHTHTHSHSHTHTHTHTHTLTHTHTHCYDVFFLIVMKNHYRWNLGFEFILRSLTFNCRLCQTWAQFETLRPLLKLWMIYCDHIWDFPSYVFSWLSGVFRVCNLCPLGQVLVPAGPGAHH